MTPKEASKRLVDAFIAGLRARPHDFIAHTHGNGDIYTLTDRVTQTEWWVANEAYGLMARGRVGPVPPDGWSIGFGFWDRRRAWRAFKLWRGEHFREVTLSERAALAMNEANLSIRKDAA